MAKRTEAYADTSAFIAFLDRSDTFNALFTRLFSEPPHLVTTPLVVAECHAWFLRRYDSNKAFQFLNFIEDLKILEVCTIGSQEQTASSTILRKFSDQKLTITDALGLHLMNARKIKNCWSTDFHLGLMGASLVINEY